MLTYACKVHIAPCRFCPFHVIFTPVAENLHDIVRQGRHGSVSILLYVNDLVITGTDLDEISRVKSQLAASFDMKDLGDLHYFLGIEVIRTPKCILINQRHYVLSILFKFGMTECKYVSTPLDHNVKLRPESGMTCDPKGSDRLSEAFYT